jgi:hypothetical protein
MHARLRTTRRVTSGHHRGDVRPWLVPRHRCSVRVVADEQVVGDRHSGADEVDMGTPADITAPGREPAKPSIGTSVGDARIAGACAIGSGSLFLAKSTLEHSLGSPPGSGPELVRWASAHAAALAWTDELLFFSASLLIPVVWALNVWLGARRRTLAAFACGLLAVSVPLVLVVGIALGRLVYPVYGIPVTDQNSGLVFTSLYVGGSHEVALVLCAALIITGPALRRVAPAWLAVLTTTAGLGQGAVAYPWVIGPDWTVLGQGVYAAWLMTVGVSLWTSR